MPTSVIPQWLQDLNTVLGMVGFLITIAVMYQVSAIKRSFRSRARLPQIIKELQRAGSSLNETLADWPERKNDARAHLKVAASLLQATLPLLPRASRAALKLVHRKLVSSIRSFNEVTFDSPDAAWDLYSDIQSSITHLNQAMRNLNWD